ncbi:hypothetical protein ACFVFS_05720 [Kitasatospora sp. NPDC057692]|uniref:hypothetical protein n=1 Tax=Kitasatospora sp. NPDC057692 TaxID=3346215 RepID=UPI0036CF8380
MCAAGLLLAGSALVTLALCHGAARGDQPPPPDGPVRQHAETSNLIPRPGGTL